MPEKYHPVLYRYRASTNRSHPINELSGSIVRLAQLITYVVCIIYKYIYVVLHIQTIAYHYSVLSILSDSSVTSRLMTVGNFKPGGFYFVTAVSYSVWMIRQCVLFFSESELRSALDCLTANWSAVGRLSSATFPDKGYDATCSPKNIVYYWKQFFIIFQSSLHN